MACLAAKPGRNSANGARGQLVPRPPTVLFGGARVLQRLPSADGAALDVVYWGRSDPRQDGQAVALQT